MALAKDSSGSTTFSNSSSPSFSFNNAAGNKLWVAVEGGSGGGADPTSVTYNGTNLTKVDSVTESAEGINMSWWYLDSPATGAHTLQANFGSNQTGCIMAISFSGAGTGYSTTTKNSTGTSTNPTLTLTVPANGGMVHAGFNNNGGISQNQGTLEINIIAFQGEYAVYQAPVSGSTTCGVTQTNGLFGVIAVSFDAAAVDLDISVVDTVTVAEDLTMNIEDDPSVVDTVTVTEAVMVDTSDEPNVFDGVTVTEAVTLEIVSGPNGDDTVTVTEVVSLLIDQLVPEVNDAVTVTEVLQMEMLVEISVSDDVAITESVTAESPLDLPVIADDVAVTESVAVMVSLEPSVNDAVSVTESGAGAPSVLVAAARDGLIHYRSTEQSQPLMMDEDEVR